MARPLSILIVDDGPGDRRLMEVALQEFAPQCQIEIAVDGEQALAYLDFCATKPALIFLDLNMPRIDGREVLRQIKSNPELKRIPVIIFTTSDDLGDILYCYENHANSVLTKPMSIDEFNLRIASVVDYWLNTVRLAAV
jgi:two-component system, chemotaxis family, response regulator Rcp1